MKAIVYDRYGPPEVLRLEEVARPTPGPGEVLVKVHATTVNRLDVHTREANRKSGLTMTVLSRAISGLRGPRRRILGTEFAGVVEAAGSGVTELSVGDRVFGSTGWRFGAHAEYLTIPATGHITTIPEGLDFEEAAAICDGALNALQCFKQADLRPGRTILIFGASGSIGTAGLQLAKHFGADITAVTSTKNLELVTSLGPNRVIDYSREDFTRNGKRYDVIFDAVGKLSFRRCRDSLEEAGVFLPTDGLGNLFLAILHSRSRGKRVAFQIPPRLPREDLLFMKGLVESGEFRPVIDRRYPLEEVIEASRYVETERKKGNVILLVHPAPR
ncbi:MAG: NAD(P)-dependent alcohol dehydrogenase [Chloroflexi bacterium]|nr:MAG: NAD(P)-dependent alcohol dehydrogenase [Chloroflexota bacterium]